MAQRSFCGLKNEYADPSRF